MLNSVDYFFNYKFAIRFCILHKLGLISNNFSIPFVEKIVLYFSLKDLETLDDARIYNYSYFFRFFLGQRSFFSGYKSFFNLGKTTFSVKVQLILSKSDIFGSLLFFSNDVFSFMDLSYVSAKFSKKKNNLYLFSYTIKDMNIFVEKKTNVGLFNLKDPLDLRVFVFSADNLSPNLLLQSFKIFL